MEKIGKDGDVSKINKESGDSANNAQCINNESAPKGLAFRCPLFGKGVIPESVVFKSRHHCELAHVVPCQVC